MRRTRITNGEVWRALCQSVHSLVAFLQTVSTSPTSGQVRRDGDDSILPHMAPYAGIQTSHGELDSIGKVQLVKRWILPALTKHRHDYAFVRRRMRGIPRRALVLRQA